jgi:ribosomal protein L16 Arg81 hydroxylase
VDLSRRPPKRRVIEAFEMSILATKLHLPFDFSTRAHRDSPLNRAERPSLAWLISRVTKEKFFRDYWEKQPLVVKRGQPDYFSALLSFNDVDHVITTMDRRYPEICLKNANDSRVSHTDYTLVDGTLDVAKIYRLFERGSTITLTFLDTVIPTLTVFCRSLESELSCPLQTNVYMTPAGAQGAKAHYDTHDVFVLQIAGSKRWTIFETPVESPRSNSS